MKIAPAMLLALAMLPLGACDKLANKPGPGGVTAGEASALDDAAEMIEAQRLPEAALRPSAPQVAPQPATSASASPR